MAGGEVKLQEQMSTSLNTSLINKQPIRKRCMTNIFIITFITFIQKYSVTDINELKVNIICKYLKSNNTFKLHLESTCSRCCPTSLSGEHRGFLKMLPHHLIQHFAHTFTSCHCSLNQSLEVILMQSGIHLQQSDLSTSGQKR